MQTFERFLTAVRLGTGLDQQSAAHAAQSVLATLFERITGGQADDVAQQLRPPDGSLPRELTLRSRPAERFELDEFLRRVAEREHIDADIARLLTGTVLNALRLVIPEKEWRDTVDQLPAEFEQLWSPHAPARATVRTGPPDAVPPRIPRNAGPTGPLSARRAGDGGSPAHLAQAPARPATR